MASNSFHLPAASAGTQPRMSPQIMQNWQDCPPQWGGLPPPGGAAPPAFAAAFAAGVAGTPPVFCTEAALTLDSPSSSDSPGHGGYAMHGPSPLSHQPPPYYGQQVAQHPPPPAAHPAAHQLQHLEQQNADLMRCCAQLQARLEAAEQRLQAQAQAQHSAQHSQASPSGSVAGASRSSQQEQPARSTPGRSRSAFPGEDLDPEERALLQRRLSAKQREAEAAAAALAAAQAATAQREGELEAERARAAALADEVAHWKDECSQRDKEARTLAQRLEAATAQCGLLDGSVAALKKKAGELGTALAQRDVAVRGLEDRLRSLQGSEGSRERQLDTLQAELEATRGERDAARREAAALQAANAELQAEVRQLDAAVKQARKEQAAALRSSSREFELIAAAPLQRTSSSGGMPASSTADGYGGPAFAPPPAAGAAHSQPPSEYADGYGMYAAPAAFDWQVAGRPPSSYAPSYISAPPPPSQQQREQQAGFGSVRTSYAGGPGGAHPAFQRYSQPAAGPASMAAQAHYVPSDAGSDACSSYGGFAPSAARAPASSPPPQAAWQQAMQQGSAGTPVGALAERLGSMGLHTPTSSSPPFATEDTLQSMLRQTQALEDRLLQLNAQRNELEAESARMPTHTTGRTQQERRRRAEVEGRLEEIGKECSSIRLQLRRLGVK